MSECGCGNCSCGQGLQIATESASAAEEIQYEIIFQWSHT